MAVSCQWGCHPKAFYISLDELRFFRPSVSLAFHKLLHLRPCYSLTLFKLGCIIISIAMKLTYFIALSWSLYFELRSTNGGQSRIRTYEKHSTIRMPSIMLANLQFAAFSRLHIRPWQFGLSWPDSECSSRWSCYLLFSHDTVFITVAEDSFYSWMYWQNPVFLQWRKPTASVNNSVFRGKFCSSSLTTLTSRLVHWWWNRWRESNPYNQFGRLGL